MLAEHHERGPKQMLDGAEKNEFRVGERLPKFRLFLREAQARQFHADQSCGIAEGSTLRVRKSEDRRHRREPIAPGVGHDGAGRRIYEGIDVVRGRAADATDSEARLAKKDTDVEF